MDEPNLRQWAAFLAVVEEGSITRAAERLHVAQPTLSQLLLALERTMGTRLLDRLPRAVVPTPAGRVLYGRAREVLRDAQAAVRDVRSVSGGAGELRIGTVASLAPWLLPPAAARWLAIHPLATLEIAESVTRGELERLAQSGQIDLAIGPPPAAWQGSIVELGSEPFVLVVPEGDPLRDRTDLRLSDFADRAWVGYTKGHGLHGLLTRMCADAGFSPRVVVSTSQVDAAVRFAAAGLGVALVPLPSIPSFLASAIVILRDLPAQPLAAFCAAHMSDLAAAFLTELRAVLKSVTDVSPAPHCGYGEMLTDAPSRLSS